jgi:hypothetical protein
LTDTIDELIAQQAISPNVGLKIMQQFDKVFDPASLPRYPTALTYGQSICEALAHKVKSKCTFKVPFGSLT